MNFAGRKELSKAAQMIDEARGIIEGIAEDEREKFDNLSEGLQASEQGQKLEDAADALENIVETLESALGEIEEARGG